ncbi:MAG: hypothetical protein MJA29_00775 [Candidatus Omnitrophica bacterium]|nr:hypothetical protein [Candidatus Omnitrophota bacterium]
MARKKSRRRRSPLQDEEYLDIETDFPDEGGWSDRFSGLSAKLFEVFKFLLGICLMPFLYASTVSFLTEIRRVPHALSVDFWAGVISFLVMHLFIWEAVSVFVRGQRLFAAAFRFYSPLARLVPAVVPFYTLLVFIVYGFLALSIKSIWLPRYILFLAGFTFILHLVFSSRAARSGRHDLLWANYIFGFSLSYISNLIVLGALLSLSFRQFVFTRFITRAADGARQVWYEVFRQVFL